MSIIKTILLATDLSELSQPALEVAIDLALAHRAGLTLLHVHQTPLFELPDGYVHNLPSQLDREYESINARLTRVERKARSSGVARVEKRILQGVIVDEILRFSHGFDFIVLATHGRTGLERWVMGSVAQQVLERASCPVIAVRPGRKHSSDSPS